jgi:hypothetical protein
VSKNINPYLIYLFSDHFESNQVELTRFIESGQELTFYSIIPTVMEEIVGRLPSLKSSSKRYCYLKQENIKKSKKKIQQL